ncbi:AAA family ATPase [Acinetobacter pittii]|uniref:AAA family ATPase n=1 Tax=Acinetobacter pittii TaxID=48296 RepID=UPI001C23B454|nr:AAA family ATPase [Acinetobacter pittii]QWZ60197.1 AAA family ATPase [Acinetobacter pittii]
MNIKEIFNGLKNKVQQVVLNPRDLEVNSCGTKSEELSTKYKLSDEKGYWANPEELSSKPPRWIVQYKNNEVRLSKDENNMDYKANRTLGFINNRSGRSAVCVFRVLFAIEHNDKWILQNSDWEALLILGLKSPFKPGTSGDAITNFDPVKKIISVGGRENKKDYKYDFIAILKCKENTPESSLYSTACDSLASLCHTTAYDVDKTEELVNDLAKIFDEIDEIDEIDSNAPFQIVENHELIGINKTIYDQISAAINSGKKNIIFYGPPGTGKTTLAEYIAGEIAESINGNRSYTMLTASSAWSSQDLIGGYQPLGNGKIGFVQGILLRNFDKPIIIDELNRCPIDKVIGPLFSVLSGQKTVLPYRVDSSDVNSPFHTILAHGYSKKAEYEHAPTDAWRLICTLNTYDKSQLSQISYALSRRFAWIYVPEPDNLEDFVKTIANKVGFKSDSHALNPIADMWSVINQYRVIGGAPIIDLLKNLFVLDNNLDIFKIPDSDFDKYISAFSMCILPLLDGLSPRELNNIVDNILIKWKIDSESESGKAKDQMLRKVCREFSS